MSNATLAVQSPQEIAIRILSGNPNHDGGLLRWRLADPGRKNPPLTPPGRGTGKNPP